MPRFQGVIQKEHVVFYDNAFLEPKQRINFFNQRRVIRDPALSNMDNGMISGADFAVHDILVEWKPGDLEAARRVRLEFLVGSQSVITWWAGQPSSPIEVRTDRSIESLVRIEYLIEERYHFIVAAVNEGRASCPLRVSLRGELRRQL